MYKITIGSDIFYMNKDDAIDKIYRSTPVSNYDDIEYEFNHGMKFTNCKVEHLKHNYCLIEETVPSSYYEVYFNNIKVAGSNINENDIDILLNIKSFDDMHDILENETISCQYVMMAIDNVAMYDIPEINVKFINNGSIYEVY